MDNLKKEAPAKQVEQAEKDNAAAQQPPQHQGRPVQAPQGYTKHQT
jgi:hypothetical protein